MPCELSEFVALFNVEIVFIFAPTEFITPLDYIAVYIAALRHNRLTGKRPELTGSGRHT
jgi:hypothetical protein